MDRVLLQSSFDDVLASFLLPVARSFRTGEMLCVQWFAAEVRLALPAVGAEFVFRLISPQKQDEHSM